MAQATSNLITFRFHNLSDVALADALGHADTVLKGAEAECKALKDEFKARGLTEVAGNLFTVSATRADCRPARYQGGERVLGRQLSPL